MLTPLIKFLLSVEDNDDTGGPADKVETPDISVYEAKIAELTGIVSEQETTIANMTSEHAETVNSLKSANYDLLKQIPADNADNAVLDTNSADADIEIDDLFEGKK